MLLLHKAPPHRLTSVPSPENQISPWENKCAPLSKQCLHRNCKIPFFHFFPRILNFIPVRWPEKGKTVIEFFFFKQDWVLGPDFWSTRKMLHPLETGPKPMALSRTGLSYSFPHPGWGLSKGSRWPCFTLSWAVCVCMSAEGGVVRGCICEGGSVYSVW